MSRIPKRSYSTSGRATAAGHSHSVVRLIDQGLEGLWLLTIAAVPLVFSPPDLMLDWFQVVKVATLRTLTGLMAMLWLVKWGIQGRSALPSYLPSSWSALRQWLHDDPARWVILGAVAFFLANVLSTLWSASPRISLWGKEPGLDGYPLYTMSSYFVLFLIIATHMKTRGQMWRFIGMVIATGTAVAAYGIVQRYGLDPFFFKDTRADRIWSTIGNPIFVGAFLVLTIPITLAATVLTVQLSRRMLYLPPLVLSLAAQFMALAFTLSRGPWAGMAIGLLIFAAIGLLFAGMPNRAKAALLATGTLASVVVFILLGLGIFAGEGSRELQSNRFVARLLSVQDSVFGKGTVVVERPVVIQSLPVTEGPDTNEGAVAPELTVTTQREEIDTRFREPRFLIWRNAATLFLQRPWIEGDPYTLHARAYITGYGPELFRYVFPLGTSPEVQNTLDSIPSYAHNFMVHLGIELGPLGLIAYGSLVLLQVTTIWMLLRSHMATTEREFKWVLIALGAVLGGRFVEELVGIPRVSDVTFFWALLGLLAALPRVFGPATASMPSSSSARARRPLGRGGVWLMGLLSLILVSLAGVTWVKNINYVRAESHAKATQKATHSAGDLGPLVAEIQRAIVLAPDAVRYRLTLGQLYEAAARSVDDAAAKRELDTLAFQVYQEAVTIAPLAATPRLSLAVVALRLTLSGERRFEQVAVRQFEAFAALFPHWWRSLNHVADVYLNFGHPKEALAATERSLALTWYAGGVFEASSKSGPAFYLRGLALRDMGNLQGAKAALLQSLALPLDDNVKAHAQRILVELEGEA